MTTVDAATRADVCVTACADVWRHDGEIVVSPMATVPAIGARLARATFAPDLMLSDGEATLVAGTWGLGMPPPAEAEAWMPFRTVFDILWSGKRHVMMSPSQIDRFGNINISAIGDFERPTRQLLGVRGAPGNTVNHATSYWLPKHQRRTFVAKVDMVSGVGYDNAEKAGPAASRYLDLRRVVTNLAVLDFDSAGHAMHLVSLHPGITIDEVVAATGFELIIDGEVSETRRPTDAELGLINDVIDPSGLRFREVPDDRE